VTWRFNVGPPDNLTPEWMHRLYNLLKGWWNHELTPGDGLTRDANDRLTLSTAVITDHGGLSGLADDDHPQYSKADGTRAFTGEVTVVTPTTDPKAANKGYVDDVAAFPRYVAANQSVPAGNTVANTASETSFASNLSIPNGTVAAGDVLRIWMAGVYSTDLVAPTLRGKLKAWGTLLDTGALTTVAGVTNGGWTATAHLFVTAIGATGSVEAQGRLEFATAAAAALVVVAENTAAITIDTTGDTTLEATVQWGTAAAANTITIRQFLVERLKAAP
jgi:hypothetical protein